jgi:hypothetical protein
MAVTVPTYEIFNRPLIDFIADLRPIIGHLPEYGLALSSAKWMAQFDESRNQRIFDLHVASKFESHIEEKNEEVFLQSSYSEFGGNQVGFVQLLKGVWSKLSHENKDAVWAHLRVLIVLNRRCRAAAT